MGGHLPVVRQLVEAGASVALANDKNYVPLDLASLGDKFEVVDYFLSQAGGLEDENAEEGGLEEAVGAVGVDGGDEEEDGEGEGTGKGKGKEGGEGKEAT